MVQKNGAYSVDISTLCDNPVIWRIVTNGYPYLQPYQMGLEKMEDAYAVTKFAVYCALGQADINAFYAEPNDPVALRMLDVLKYLVNEVGARGDIPAQNVAEINEVKGISDAGDFCYQDYIVNSKINMKGYTVTSIEGFPVGSYVSDTTNMQRWTFAPGETFRVLMPKNQINMDFKGTINVKCEVENYPVFYGEAPDASHQNYVITYDTFGEENVSKMLQVFADTGRLKVLKVDNETKLPLKGVKFKLQRNGTNQIYEAVTNEKGEILFQNLIRGKYTLTELETNKNYNIENSSFQIDIEYDKTTQITIDNSIKKGKLKIVKVDKDTQKPIQGVKFEILNKLNGEVIEGLITDENGEAISKDLRVDGQYILKEVETIEGYILDETEYEFTVGNDIFEIKLENEKKKGNFKIIKIDSEDDNIKLSGVKFEVYNSEMELLETLETDENGEAISKDYPAFDEKYYIKEIFTKDGYVLNDKIIEVNLKENETIEIYIDNAKVPEEPKETPKLEPKIVPQIPEEPEEITVPEPVEPMLVEPEPIPEPEIVPEPEIEIPTLPKTGM